MKVLNDFKQACSAITQQLIEDLTAEEQMEIERLKMHKQILLEDIEKLKNQIENVMADIQDFKSAED
ncbi:hypothetical protein cypCar_00044212, partial [Cyprinus carpio]